jgi:DNA-binding GntR family transcriptional regulator
VSIGGEHRPLREIVCDTIRSQIVSGEHAPGAHLVEDRLAKELGVSRNPVREALRVLESEGFVEMIPRKGAVVATLSDDEVRDIFEVRRALEALSARLAADHRDDDGAGRMNDILDRAQGALDRGDRGQLVELNTAFHECVLELSGNGYLFALMQQLRGRMQWIFSRTAGTDRGQHSVDEHRRLAQAIADGDGPTAAKIAATHVDAAAASYWNARREIELTVG